MFFRAAFDTIIYTIQFSIRTRTLLLIAFLTTISGCVGTKYLEANQSLVIQKPEITGVSGNHHADLIELAAQQPNKRLFGFLPFSYLVYAYHMGEKRFDPEKEQKKIDKLTIKYDRKIADARRQNRKDALLNKKTSKIDDLIQKKEEGNWLMRLGEPLAIFDTSKIAISEGRFYTYLTTHGFFLANVTHDVVQKSERKKRMVYSVKSGPQYIIDSIQWQVADSSILSILNESSNEDIIKKGLPYDQQMLENERNRIYDLLTNSGYFTFSRQFVGFEVDTFSLNNHRILLREKISNPIGENHRRFTIDSIVFYSSSNQNINRSTSSYRGITYQFGERKYSPKVLSNRIFLDQDSLYSRANTIKTQRQLSYLDAFRFVNINYDSLNDHQLIANIFTSPLNRFQTSAEAGAIAASQQAPGPFVNLGLKNRNTFNSLETIDLQGNFSLQGIPKVGNESTTYSLFQYGGSASITYPRFLFPTSDRIRRMLGSFNPQTRIRFSYNYEDRTNEYERSRAEFNFSYLWTKQERSQYTFTPFTFSFIDAKLENDFRKILDDQVLNGNGALRAAFNSSVISSSSFEALYNIIPRRASGENAFVRIFLETGGNLVNLLGEDFFLRTNRVAADEFSLYKWTKFNADFRRVQALPNGAHLAYRVNFGLAYPYGKDPSLPYEKRFYIGGSNSLRAWQVRRLGPGAYANLESTTSESQPVAIVDYQLEQGGDMILESSIEFRKKLIGFVDYAFFVDAGNIWLVNSNSNQIDDQGDDGFFRFDSFGREIAVDAGMGLRLDFSFFVFRLDGAFQVVDPAQPLGSRWVLDDIHLGRIGRMSEMERDIFKNKTNLTIGIGLPF